MKREELDELIDEGRLSNSEILLGSSVLTPNQVLDAIDEDQYEVLTLQWAYYHLKKKYIKVYQLGSSGDKGRDICAIIDKEKDIWDLYQCKHYSKQLSPTMIYLEMGKLCYFSYKKEYSIPKKYYFVSPKGVGSDLEKLIRNPELFRMQISENWEKYCEKKIEKGLQIKLSGDFHRYFNVFDFSIVDWIEPNEFIDQFRHSPFFSRWFGGGLSKTRKKLPTATKEIQENELIYIKEIFKAYGDYLNKTIEEVKDFSDRKELINHFNRQRDSFYVADSLYQFSRDVLPYGNKSFEQLKDDTYHLIIDIVESDFENGFERLKAAIQEAKRGHFKNNPLNQEINMQDRTGVCHHLVNDERINWVL